jgi:hypothetical protein
MQIIISQKQLLVNGAPLHFPISIATLQELLGPCRHVKKKYNHIYTWDELGMLAYSKAGKQCEAITLEFGGKDYDFIPAQPFSGQLTVEGESYQQYLEHHRSGLRKVTDYDEGGTLVVGDYDLFFSQENGFLEGIVIQPHVTPPPKVYSDKYKFRPIDGTKIEFTDFNFKLAVVQVLMYEKKLLQPEFDLYDFVENHEAREINVEKEGYDFIPEVKAWFEQLEIDSRLAGEVTEIVQDGGDDIYGHMLRFWSGEDDTFNITRFDDVQHFPNLRKMSLFYADNLDEIKQLLAAKNIEVESI